MSDKPNNPFRFWQELKRRRVIRFIPVYAAASFVILELVDIITEPFGLPDWTLKFVVVLLSIGFVISIILSWIYDVTPEGVKKTKPISKVTEQQKETGSKMIGWKITSYVSVVIIIGLLLVNIFGSGKQVEVDTSLEKSIAVLPFHNYSGDPNQEFICFGLTDEIITHLYKVESFDEVRSLTTVLNYKNSDKSTTEIAEELGVNYILEGSYKRIGDELRVTAQLIEPKSDNHIWLQDYDRPREEIITIPADIALQIAAHIKAFLTESETQNIQKIPTGNLEAYELLQQASLLVTDELNKLDQGLDLCLQAIELDPDYADAYSWAGTTFLLKGCYGGGSEMQSVIWGATHYLEKALELNQNNASAHMGMGIINDWVKWDYIKAEKEYLKAIELEPNNLILYGTDFYIKMNRLEDALLFIKKFTENDRTQGCFEMTQSHILSSNKKEAYNSIRTDLESRGESAFIWVGENYIWLEEYDSAKIYLESAIQSEQPDMLAPKFQACLALVYKKTNSNQKALKIINQLIATSDETTAGSPAYFTGWYYSGIGEVDSAFYWLEKAYKNRSPEMPWLKVDPVFKNLKEDDRYWDLYERTGHKAYDEYMAGLKK